MSQPVIVIAKLKARADKREALIAGAAICVAATRQEPGCITYDCHESLTEPGRFVFVEQWQDRAALETHMTLPHLKAFVTLVGSCLAEAPEIEAISCGNRWRLA